jgi:hypothetical protein
MEPQEIEKRIIQVMTDMQPVEAKIIDRHITYHSTTATHNSYREQLINADRETRVYRTYLMRCYDWIRLLKNRKVEIKNIIKK